MKTLIILIILNIACSNTSKTTNNSKSANKKEDIQVMKLTLKRSYVKEKTNFKIKKITQTNKSLDIFVTYSGGCGEEHQFELISNGKIDNNGVVDFYLVDHTKGDNCKMMLMQTKHFDISKVSRKKKFSSFRINDERKIEFKK